MASSEAIKALLKSSDEWNKFKSSQTEVIDLKISELKGAMIPNRNLCNCDFSGADLENANIDGCIIKNSIFENSCLEGVSMVNCKIDNSSFKNSNFKNATIRHSVFKNSVFDNSDVSYSVIELCEFYLCILQNITSSNVNFFNLVFKKSSFLTLIIDKGSFLNLSFREQSLNDSQFVHSTLSKIEILSSSINSLKLTNCEKNNLNFTSSLITNVNMEEFDLSNSIFFDSLISKCIWPEQRGKTSLLGKYKASSNLISQPVQDIKGIQQVLRRNIADAQFLKETLSNNSTFTSVANRLWGLTTAYGQSLLRLIIFSICVMIILTAAYCLSDGIRINIPENLKNGWNALKLIASTFIGMENQEVIQKSQGKETISVLSRIFGFITTGLLLGIAANKLGKLSSE